MPGGAGIGLGACGFGRVEGRGPTLLEDFHLREKSNRFDLGLQIVAIKDDLAYGVDLLDPTKQSRRSSASTVDRCEKAPDEGGLRPASCFTNESGQGNQARAR